MNDIAVTEILCGVYDKLHHRKIRKADGHEFSVRDLSKVISFFGKENSATSIEYGALIQLEGCVYDGYITIYRNGVLRIRLK